MAEGEEEMNVAIIACLALGTYELAIYIRERYEEDLLIMCALYGVAMFLTVLEVIG